MRKQLFPALFAVVATLGMSGVARADGPHPGDTPRVQREAPPVERAQGGERPSGVVEKADRHDAARFAQPGGGRPTVAAPPAVRPTPPVPRLAPSPVKGPKPPEPPPPPPDRAGRTDGASLAPPGGPGGPVVPESPRVRPTPPAPRQGPWPVKGPKPPEPPPPPPDRANPDR